MKCVEIKLKKEDECPEQRAGILLPIIKDLSSLNSEFISCNATHYMYRYHLDLFASPDENWI